MSRTHLIPAPRRKIHHLIASNSPKISTSRPDTRPTPPTLLHPIRSHRRRTRSAASRPPCKLPKIIYRQAPSPLHMPVSSPPSMAWLGSRRVVVDREVPPIPPPPAVQPASSP